jgi:hypothetical protein
MSAGVPGWRVEGLGDSGGGGGLPAAAAATAGGKTLTLAAAAGGGRGRRGFFETEAEWGQAKREWVGKA